MPDDKERNLGGRPTKYRPEYNLQARKLCLLGATIPDLADFFDVNGDTIYEWAKQHEGFSDAIKTGRGDWNKEIEKNLAHRAMGYECVETQFFTYQGEVTDERTVIKHYPPDTAAAIFMLCNRDPEHYRNRQEFVHTGEIKKVDDVLDKVDSMMDK
jgi:hypothetical protein